MPIVGSAVLFSLFIMFTVLPKDLVNTCLSAYFLLLGTFALSASILPFVEPFFPKVDRLPQPQSVLARAARQPRPRASPPSSAPHPSPSTNDVTHKHSHRAASQLTRCLHPTHNAEAARHDI